MVELTSGEAIIVVLAMAGFFAFGYVIGHSIGRTDGEGDVAEWYGRKRREEAKVR